MADKKISQLTAATTPLAGTEVLPIVQGTTTVKVANNDLRPKQIQSNATSGVLQVTGPAAASTRVMTTPDANFTVARTDAAQNFVGNNTFDTNTLAIDASNNRVGILNASPDYALDVLSPTVQFGAKTVASRVILNVGDSTASGTYAIAGGGSGNPAWDIGTSIAPTTYSISYTLSGVTTEHVRIVGSSGDIYARTGNFVVGTSGKGIDFSATASGSGTMTSELLADYEEGTWTPVLSDGTNNATSTENTQGRYTKIGRVVYLQFTVQTSSLGSVTGDLQVSGLPYTADTNTGPGVVTSSANQLMNVLSGQFVSGRILGSTNYVQLWTNNTAVGMSRMVASEWSADGYANFAGYYIV